MHGAFHLSWDLRRECEDIPTVLRHGLVGPNSSILSFFTWSTCTNVKEYATRIADFWISFSTFYELCILFLSFLLRFLVRYFLNVRQSEWFYKKYLLCVTKQLILLIHAAVAFSSWITYRQKTKNINKNI